MKNQVDNDCDHQSPGQIAVCTELFVSFTFFSAPFSSVLRHVMLLQGLLTVQSLPLSYPADVVPLLLL